MNKTLRNVLQEGIEILEESKIIDAKIDAWYLFEYCFQITRTYYLIHQDNMASQEETDTFFGLIKKRSSHIPVQHLIGTSQFMGLEFKVNEHVLIPRQDTECLVEEALKYCENKAVLDVCTGTGCIIISLSKLSQLERAVAVDISKEAFKVATDNVIYHNAPVELLESDLFEKVTGTFDLIVSNPPYIPTKDIEELEVEVKCHEPMLALDGFADGLHFYRQIITQAPQYLKQEGYLFFEIGYDQGEAVSKLMSEKGFTKVTVKKDLAGLDRVVFGQYEPGKSSEP